MEKSSCTSMFVTEQFNRTKHLRCIFLISISIMILHVATLLVIISVYLIIKPHVIQAAMRAYTVANDSKLSGKLSKLYGDASDKTFHDITFIGSSTMARLPTFLFPKATNLGQRWISTHHIVQNANYLDHIIMNICVLYIGVNDLITGIPPKQIAYNIRQIIDRLRAHTIIYIPIIPSPFQKRVRSKSYLESVEKETRSAIKAPSILLSLPHFVRRDFSADGLHLSKSGYEKLAKALQECLLKHGIVVQA